MAYKANALYLDVTKKSHYKLLKRISRRTTISAESLSEEELDICSYLHSLKLIECNMQNPIVHENAYGFQSLVYEHVEYSITQAGKAEIYNFKSTFYKWWIPVVISIIALIVSIAAVLVQVLIR